MMFLPSSYPDAFFPLFSSSSSSSSASMTGTSRAFTVFDITDPSVKERCDELATPSMTTFSISCFLIFWTLFSYIPQYARIIRRQSAEGLSTLYILLGALSGVCAVANILVLPSSQVDIGCCRTNNTFPCIAGLLGMIQVISGVGCFWVVMFLYVYYAQEEAEAERTGRRPSMSSQVRTYRRARRGYALLLIVFAWVLLILVVSAVILHRFPWVAQNWADFLGVMVAGLACIQWLPQVFTTWHLGHLGSLSVAMLALSTPSTCLFAYSLISRVGIAGWSVWIVYVLVASMQLVLIVTAIMFAIRDYNLGEPGLHTIADGRQGSIWDSYSVSSSDDGEYEADADSMIAPSERMSLLGSVRRKERGSKARGSISKFFGLQMQHKMRQYSDDTERQFAGYPEEEVSTPK